MTENWRSVEGFPGYQVSNLGRVQSFKSGDIFGLVLSPSRGNKAGRALVTLYLDGRKKYRLVSRLVCEAFNGAPSPGAVARHRNGDHTDDRAENLAWGTALQNAQDRDEHGRTARGERHYAAVLTEADVSTIRTAYASRKSQGNVYGFITKTANAYNVKIGCIEDIVYGRSWRHLA